MKGRRKLYRVGFFKNVNIMNTINVKFRVTGIYVGSTPKEKREIIVSVKENPTVFDIMNAVSNDAKGGKLGNLESFTFLPTNPGEKDSIKEIQAKFKKEIKDHRLSGTYKLIDDSTSNPYKTFQYYIYDRDFKQLNNDGKTIKFAQKQSLETKIRDGYTVVIRQICILTTSAENELNS